MRRTLLGILLLCGAVSSLAWDSAGHRTITDAAIDLLPEDMPSWLRDADIRAQLGFQSNEPDHYRGTKIAALTHENAPDHYLDVEELERFGLTLRTLPPLRYEFVAIIAKPQAESAPAPGDAAAPTQTPTPPPRRGVDRRPITDEVGFVPYAIVEHHAKLVSSFNTLRILERLNGPERGAELEAARANVIHEMGQLSHFVGDAAQPLHTTIHHHGWKGANPDGFTTDTKFHAYIDGEVVALHGIDSAALAKVAKKFHPLKSGDVWSETIDLIERSFAQVKPLYAAQKEGSLQQAAGRAMIADRMADAACVLAMLCANAWTESAPTEEQVRDFVRFDKGAKVAGELVPAQR